MPVNERADEDDDDEDDLPADADGRVGGVADEMADHRVVDDALQPRDDVLQHRRPRQPPDGWTDGTLDNRSVEFLGCYPRVRPQMLGQSGSLGAEAGGKQPDATGRLAMSGESSKMAPQERLT